MKPNTQKYIKTTEYYSLADYFQDKYGERTFKLSIEGGFTCPNIDGSITKGGCVYCNVKSYTYPEQGSIETQTLISIEKLSKKRINSFVVYFQSFSNTYAPLHIVKDRIEQSLIDDRIKGIYIGTRPDVIEDDKIEYLSELNKKYDVVVELGLQSANDETLKYINRGHSVAQFVDAAKRCKDAGLMVGAHVIFGLPTDSFEQHMKTVELLNDIQIDMVKFHNLDIIEGTDLAEKYLKGEFPLITEEEYINSVAHSIVLLPNDTIIARVVGDSNNKHHIAGSINCYRHEFIEKLNSRIRELRG